VNARAGDPQRASLAKGLKPVAGREDDAGTPGAMLRAAGAAVRVSWQDERGDSVDVTEAMHLLEWLVTAAQHAAWGGVPEHAGPAANPLGRHLLDHLRTELVRAWRAAEPPPTHEAMLTVLEAVERVREAIDPDWSQFFTSRLSGPEGLDLVVDMAHDIRSPLTSVLFLAETLHRGQSGPVSDLQRRQLRLIYSAALGLSTLTSDVIELARGGDQLADKEAEPFSLAELLDTLHDLVRPVAEEKGLAVRYTVSTTDHRIGRPLALSRVLLNLTTNALKFTDEGYVEITTKSKGMNGVEFSVRDTGRGMSPEAAAGLYLPFRRSRSRKGPSGYHFSGTGLGLAMCRKLLEALGSELKYETKPDWGTRFYFELDLPPASRLTPGSGSSPNL
jgi:signal transduction histidine kinase